MNNHIDFVVGKDYLVRGEANPYQCIAHGVDGKAIVQSTVAPNSVFKVSEPTKWSEYVKPPVITKSYRNVYEASLGAGVFPSVAAARAEITASVKLAQLEYTYTDNVLTDVAFIKQIGN